MKDYKLEVVVNDGKGFKAVIKDGETKYYVSCGTNEVVSESDIEVVKKKMLRKWGLE